MPKVLFLVNLLEHGTYTCHVRVEFGVKRELQEFLERNNAPNCEGWDLRMSRPATRGYDGKPLYQADIRLSKHLSLPPPPELSVHDDLAAWPSSSGDDSQCPTEGVKQALSWQERSALQKETKGILSRLGVTDLGIWR
jgi:hypothetical protein